MLSSYFHGFLFILQGSYPWEYLSNIHGLVFSWHCISTLLQFCSLRQHKFSTSVSAGQAGLLIFLTPHLTQLNSKCPWDWATVGRPGGRESCPHADWHIAEFNSSWSQGWHHIPTPAASWGASQPPKATWSPHHATPPFPTHESSSCFSNLWLFLPYLFCFLLEEVLCFLGLVWLDWEIESTG